MSDLLFSWLNDELQLSKRVLNLEQDFHNGFLFGEILSKYKQQLNLNEFVNKDDKASRLNNFELLFDTMKALKVSFDSNIVIDIIEKKPGVAKKVLYQLKMQLEKTNVINTNKFTKGTKTLSPLKKIQISKDKFDKLTKEHFSKQVHELHRAQKTILEENALKKYTDFHTKQINLIEEQEQKEMHAKLMDRKRFREKQLDNIKNSNEFRTRWEQSNIQKWSKNITTRNKEAQKTFNYHQTIQHSKLQSHTFAQLSDLKLLDNDIKAFENKLNNQQPLSDSQEDNPPATHIAKQTSKIAHKLTSNPIKEDMGRKRKNIVGQENNKHQREKKRRTMIVEQNKRHKLLEINRREIYIIETIQQTSKQEKQLEYQIWRAWQNKQIIIENKKLTMEKENEKQQTRKINNQFKKEELLKTYRTQHQNQVKIGVERQKKLEIDKKVKDRKNIYQQCWNIVENLINITEHCFESSQQTNSQQLSPAFIDHLFNQFVHSANTPLQLAKLQLNSYIQGKGEWNIPVKVDPAMPTDPKLENAIPHTPTNNYYLGNILKTLFHKLYSKNTKHQNPTKVDLNSCISILGLQFAGKKTVAEQLSKKYGVNVIIIEDIIMKRIQQYSLMKERMLQVSKQTEQIVEICYSGKQLPNSLLLILIEQELKKNPNSIIIDYPNTYEQSTQLTHLLSGIRPSDLIPPSALASKIQSFSRLVKPTPSKIIPSAIKSCGLDCILWIDISCRQSLDRFLGRRWIKDKVYHINGQIDDVDSLKIGEKASALIYKNDLRINNRKNIEGWFKNFGIEMEDGIKRQSWMEINGECSEKELVEKVTNLWKEISKLKEKETENKAKELKHKEEENKKKQLQRIALEELKHKCVFTSNEDIKKELIKAHNSIDFNSQFLQNITGIWEMIQNNTINLLVESFKRIQIQQEENNQYIAEIKKSYIGLLTREDQKFYLVKLFQNQYNNFFDRLADMINHQYTKQQLHQRVEDLEDQLFNIVQSKKQQAIDERNSIINSGWLEMQLQKFILCIQVIVQAQLQRSVASQQIIADFYSKKYNIEQKDIEEYPIEIQLDSTLQMIKEQSSPKIEKLIAEALRLFNREEDQVDDKNKKGGKAAKKEDKKAPKKGGKQQVQQKKQPTAQELEMKKAINTQKAIFRYRLNIIGNYAQKKINSIYQKGKKLYRDLQDLYNYTIKVENKSISNLTSILKRSIQKEQKIQNQLQINYVEVIESEVIRNFQKPKPTILPAQQEQTNNRFTITNLKKIISLFKNESQNEYKINTKRLMTVFEKLINNNLIKIILPPSWKSLNVSHFIHFIKLLDYHNQGYVELPKIYIFFIMTNFKTPTIEQLKKYKLSLTKFNDTVLEIDEKQFVECPSWFDEDIPAKQNMRQFERNKLIKHLLFQIFSTTNQNKQYLNISRYLQFISLQIFQQQFNQENPITYFEYAFG